MAECKQLCFEIPGFGSRKIAADFGGGNVSSDGGVLLLRQVHRWLGLTKQVARVLPDYRDPDRITHSLESLVRQRIYGLALGYEDLNEHDLLRSDVVWQTAAERGELLGSSSTLCRWENRAGPKIGLAVARSALQSVRRQPLRLPQRNWSWTSTVPTIRYTATKWERPSTATTTITAFCRSTSSVGINCWLATCVPAILIRLSMPGRLCDCWSRPCVDIGQR
jgi:Transposase DDE domain group 1